MNLMKDTDVHKSVSLWMWSIFHFTMLLFIIISVIWLDLTVGVKDSIMLSMKQVISVKLGDKLKKALSTICSLDKVLLIGSFT